MEIIPFTSSLSFNAFLSLYLYIGSVLAVVFASIAVTRN